MQSNLYEIARRYGHHATTYGVKKFLAQCERNGKWKRFDSLFSNKEDKLAELGWKYHPEERCLEGTIVLTRRKNADRARKALKNLRGLSHLFLVPDIGVWSKDELSVMLDSISNKIWSLANGSTVDTQGRDVGELVADWLHYKKIYDVGRYTSASEKAKALFEEAMDVFYHYYSVDSDTIYTVVADKINSLYPNARLNANQKWSKALRKVLTVSGALEKITEKILICSYDEYGNEHSHEVVAIEKYFAEFGDATTELEKPYKVKLSVLPEDFALASHGNSWNSCASPDKSGARPYNRSGAGRAGGYGGCYCAGQLSYAADEVTLVLFAEGNECKGDGNLTYKYRLWRQLFSFNWRDTLLQGRFYPFDQTDGGTDNYNMGLADYDATRTAIQTLLAAAMGVPNDWELFADEDAKRCSRRNDDYIETNGYQYADYSHYERTNITVLKGVTDTFLSIGETPVCLGCGNDTVEDSGQWTCWSCYNHEPSEPRCRCGSDEELRRYDGEWVCNDCMSTCSDCGQPMPVWNLFNGLCNECVLERDPDYSRCECGCGRHGRTSEMVAVVSDENGTIRNYLGPYHAPGYRTLGGRHILSGLVTFCPECGNRRVYNGRCYHCNREEE